MSTAQGRQIGPPMVTHYDQHTRLPLTPNAAAVVASGTTPPPSSAPMNRVHQAPQPIVEVVTENQENGQLSRYTLNHNRQTIAPFTTGPRFTAARPALQPPNSNGYRAANRPPGGLAPLISHLANENPHSARGGISDDVRKIVNENLPARGALPCVFFKGAPVMSTTPNGSRLRQSTAGTVKLFTKGISYTYHAADLTALLRPYGDVLDPQVHQRHDGRAAGSGTATMMQNKAQRAIRGLNGKVIGGRTLVVKEYKDEPWKRRSPSPRGRSAPQARRKRAKSLQNLKEVDRLARRGSASIEVPQQTEAANSWPRNATPVAEAGAVPYIAEIPSAFEPPPGEPRKPDIAQELLANKARPVADGMETVAESTMGGTIVGRRWQPMTSVGERLREVPEEDSPSSDGDLIDLGDGEDEKDDETASLMTFTTVARRPSAAPARVSSLLDD